MKNKNKQTKFPVARIKKIMQKDEEVGKVAQATPIVISKALELFLALLIEESSKVTVNRGSKKVESYHLKHAVETVDMLDFLKEIVEAVPDPSAGGTIDLEAENAEQKKKRGKGKRTTVAAAAADGSAGNGAAPKKRRKKKTEAQEDKDMDIPAALPGPGDEGGSSGADATMYDRDEEEVEQERYPARRRSPDDDDDDWQDQ